MYRAREQIDAVLKHLYKFKDGIRSLHIDTILQNKELLTICGSSIEIERMVGKLKEDKYVHIHHGYPKKPDGKDDMSKGLFNYCGITFEGRLFWESGGYTKDLKRKKIAEFPKTYWWVIAIFGFIFGFFADVIKERLKQKTPPPSNQSQQGTQSVGYNSPTHKNLPYYLDTFYIGVDTVYK